MIKPVTVLTSLALLAGAAFASAADAKEDVLKAAKALADKPNYSWKSTVKVPPDAQFQPGPTEGKVEKGGYLMTSSTGFQGGQQYIIKKGEKGALTNRDGGWDSIADAENAEGFGRFRAVMARNLKAPADDVGDLLKDLKELKKDGDVYSGEFTEEGAKNNMSFGGRRGGGPGGQGPQINSAKGSAKFWVKDGLLSKMEIKVVGSMDFNGNDFPVDRTTTTEIKDVGATKIEVPEGAKAKLN